ncbi:uncharacterized protein FOMMEDRAFT_83275 [Fomitiporia mediterranea MF3/22]|uniref:uncharacterized protein n=1 Tax=Fomitiporia mediterranea (strain MF3/22) TaxID=694068 RepID=UPI0004407F4D|nr:uncharacterized protein FOMMEDRAFT_83275 [Fomitiporia mediterranea MF3/22]EJD03692.1 hypothetical protein FOMMEDRAFT_83275 [Fomitiporia mediterranea MF3/22]
MLPPFLKPISKVEQNESYPFAAVYTHSENLGKSESYSLWWPWRAANTQPSVVLLFVPGNPGLADFYIPYLSHISESAPDSLAILAHSLIGHSPRVAATPLAFSRLEAQVEGIIEIVDNIDHTFGSATSIVLIGHSVGAWIVLQALRERSQRITSAFLLFPTIAHIARTPNGSRFSWLFHGPIPHILASMSLIFRVIPKRTISLLFRGWPDDQVKVLWSFLNSPSSILAALTMAREEMATIKDLDKVLLHEVKDRLYFFLAEADDWVGINKDAILREMSDDLHSVRVVHGQHGIPHAYCIS